MKITEDLGKEIRAKAEAGESHRIIAEWCEKQRAVRISKAAVTKYLRAPGGGKADNRPKLSKPAATTKTGPTTAKVTPEKLSATKKREQGSRKGIGGRPTLYTQELSERLLKDVEDGATFEIAAEANGISGNTLYEWLGRSREGDPKYAGLHDALARARASYKRAAIERIRKGVLNSGERDWKAEAMLLERLYPNEFGPQAAVSVKVESELDRIVKKLEEALPPEIFDAVARALVGDRLTEPTE